MSSIIIDLGAWAYEMVRIRSQWSHQRRYVNRSYRPDTCLIVKKAPSPWALLGKILYGTHVITFQRADKLCKKNMIVYFGYFYIAEWIFIVVFTL